MGEAACSKDNRASNVMWGDSHALLMVFGITLLALGLRLYKLGVWSFWGDEMFTLSGLEDGFNYSRLRQSLSQTAIQHLVSQLGISEWNARVIPALIGACTIPLHYILVRRIWGSSVALIAALLLTFAPWHLYWSQNARFYVALLLFYTLAQLLFFRGMEEDKPGYLWLSLLCLGLAAKERLLALFLIPVFVTYLICLVVLPVSRPPGLRWRNFFLVAAPLLLLIIFFAGPYLRNLSSWMEGFGYANNNPLWLFAGVVYYVTIPVVCLALAGAFFLFRQGNRGALYLGLGAIVPLVLLLMLAPFHYTANRYVFITLTSWLVLASLAIVELFRLLKGRGWSLAFGILVLVLGTMLVQDAFYFVYQNGNRDDWKGAFQIVRSQKLESDLVVARVRELGDYYLGSATVDPDGLDLARLSEQPQRVWFVEDMVAEALYPQITEWFVQRAKLVAVRDVFVQGRLFTMRVYLYEPEQDEPLLDDLFQRK